MQGRKVLMLLSIPRRLPREACQERTEEFGECDRRRRAKVRTLRIAAIPGDGIGREVIAAGAKVLEACASATAASARLRPFRLGLERYKKSGAFMPGRTASTSSRATTPSCSALPAPRRARPHHAVGPPPCHLPALRPVRQRAPHAHPAGHHQPAPQRHRPRSSTG